MSITSFMEATCTQDAVYWGNPEDDGSGGKTYDSPVAIKCRWEGKDQLLKEKDSKGNIIESPIIAYVLQDLDIEGCIFLGTLDDLDSGADVDPLSMDGVHIINQFEKIPALGSTTEFVRKVMMTQWQYK
jgi:hypothetical protein